VNLNAIKQLTDLLAKSNLASLTYEDNEFKLSLSAQSTTVSLPVRTVPQFTDAVASANTAVGAGEASARSIGESTPGASLVTVTAPVVGTVYRAREQGKSPLVSLGETVRTGDALCVIEAMKMFSEITSPCNGSVVEIAFADGALAEFGSKLIVIEPSVDDEQTARAEETQARAEQTGALQGGGK
jgi:acetyl-CoA carboxylase biotin carboxyl carrier protein